MIVRNKIWEEIKQAYANVLCLRWYTDKQRKYERWCQMFVAIVASGGTFGYLINSYFPLVSTATIAFVAVVKSLFPQILQPERELCILDDLMDFYNKYMIDMESLLYNSDKEKISEEETFEEMYSIKKEETAKQSLMNKLVRSIPPKRHEQFIKEADEYIKRVYYNEYE